MRQLLKAVDDLLRGNFTKSEDLAAGRVLVPVRTLTVVALLLGILYGLFMGLYAVLREDGCDFKGIVREPGLFPGLPRAGKAHGYLDEAGRDLPATTARWRAQLHGLMARFLEGQSEIQPTDGRKGCKAVYCELQSLCRIGELEALRNASGGAS